MALSISNSHIKQTNNKAFTLVELAIVLVIIGLIISGILVGQDLVRSAENRAIISQIDKYNAAVNSFRNKFNAIPGDFAQGASYIAGATDGDGNGILFTAAGVPGAAIVTSSYEISEFWYQLSQLGMIEGSYDGTTATTVLGQNFPLTKSNRGGVIAYGSTDSINYYHIGLAPSATTAIVMANNLTTDSALLIDTKMDDGKALTGSVVAAGGATISVTVTGTGATITAFNGATLGPLGLGTGCVVSSGGVNLTSIYNTGNSGYLCQLRIRFM